MLLWIPVVSLIVDDETDQCPAKRWRVRDDDDDKKTCVICLEEYTKMAKVTLVHNGIMTHRPPSTLMYCEQYYQKCK